MSKFGQGLEVSLLAMVITFLALGVFILVMVVLQRIFRGPADEEQKETELAAEETPLVSLTIADESEEGAIAAAIVAALTYYQAVGMAQLGSALREGKGAWWVSRRSEASLGKVARR